MCEFKGRDEAVREWPFTRPPPALAGICPRSSFSGWHLRNSQAAIGMGMFQTQRVPLFPNYSGENRNSEHGFLQEMSKKVPCLALEVGPAPGNALFIPLVHAHLYCTPVHQSHGGTETGRLVPRTMSSVRPGYLFVPQRGREGQPARQKRVLEHKCKNHTTMSRGRFRKRLPITTHEPPSMAMTTSHHLAPGPQDTWLIAGIQVLNAGQKAEHHRIPGPRPRGTFSGCCQLPWVPAPRRQDSHTGGINRGRGRAGRR